MADKKISQLNAVITLGNNDLFPVVQGAETKKAKLSDIKTYLPTASSVNTGLLSNTDWTTFNNKQNALTLGNLSESTSSVLTITGGTGSIIGSGTTIQVKQSSGSQSGFLSSTDWTTFNNKMSGLTLTTTGTSGAATYNSGTATLNIPQYLGAAVTSINGSTTAAQTIQTGSTGTDFSIATVAGVTTVAIPTASASARGLLSTTDWSTFNGKQNALTIGNLTESTSSVLTITGGTGSIIGSGTTIQVKQASGLQSGFLASSDFTTFAGKQNAITLTTTGSSGAATFIGNVLNIPQYSGGGGGVTSVGGTAPINSSGGTTPTISIDNARANGTGKGAATFSASDFNDDGAGLISLDYTNAQFATSSQNGFLKSSDWSAFDSKLSTITAVDLQSAHNALGGNIKGFNVTAPDLRQNAGQLTPSNGLLILQAYYLNKQETIAGVNWFQVTIGSFTANNYNGIALYSYNGGTLTLVASSTNDGNCFQQAGNNSWKSKAFSSTYSASAGIYFIGLLANWSAATTSPGFGATTSSISGNSLTFNFTNSAKLNGSITNRTSLPSTQASSGITAQTTIPLTFLY